MSDPHFPLIQKTKSYSPQNSLAMILFCQLSYLNSYPKMKERAQEWGYAMGQPIKSDPKSKYDGDAMFFEGEGHDVLVIRGTEPTNLVDWLTNAKFLLDKEPWGRVHHGFQKTLDDIWPQLLPLLKGRHRPIFLTGHSQGAALICMTAARIAQQRLFDLDLIQGIYAMASPRFCNGAYQGAFNATFKEICFRVVNDNDIVPSIPPEALGYRHVGSYLHLSEGGRLLNNPSASKIRKVNFQEFLQGKRKIDLDHIDDHWPRAYVKLLREFPEVED